MNIIDTTPPADLPTQTIVIDKELGLKRPGKAFYLRARLDLGVDHIDLDNVVTPIEARSLAQKMGFDPKHWMAFGDTRATAF